jgi:RNA polymerase-binding transcription factor DksA
MKRPPAQSRRAGPQASTPSESETQGLPGVPKKWLECYRALLITRERIEAERQALCTALQQPLERFSMDMADAATDEFEQGLTACALSAEQDLLYEIDEALQRLKNNSYGICQITGARIPMARLQAVPWTRFAKPVERQLEKSGEVRHAQLGELKSVSGVPTNISLTLAGEQGELEVAAPEEDLTCTAPIPGAGEPRMARVARRSAVAQKPNSRHGAAAVPGSEVDLRFLPRQTK